MQDIYEHLEKLITLCNPRGVQATQAWQPPDMGFVPKWLGTTVLIAPTPREGDAGEINP